MVELAENPSHVIGPTWTRTVDGGFWLPEHSLGYGVVNWLYKYVRSPGGEFAGEAFLPTDEQFRFIVWWYAIDDQGNFIYRDGVLRRLKGWGKDPLAAALALAELCGPVRFSHWDEAGNPVGKMQHAAWVQIAAVSQEQTKNSFSLFPVMISSDLKADYNLDVNKFVIYADGGSRRIESVTASPASMEGNRPTFVIKNEVQWWGSGPDGSVNEGITMSDVIDGNVTKIPNSRALAICNAHIPGNGSVAENDYDLWQDIQSGKAIDPGLLYDALEAPADTPVSEIPSQIEDPEGYAAGVEKLRQGVLVARGDATWLPVDEIVDSILDSRKSIIESRRKFLNQVNAAEDSWIAPYEWDACKPDPSTDPPLRPLTKGDTITLGFDGSKSDDWTALVACRVDDASLHLIQVWNPKNYPNEEVPREDVDAVVRSTMDRYDVVSFRADVFQFEAYVDQWSARYKNRIKVNATPGNPIAFDMRGQTKKFSLDCERFVDAVLKQEIVHDGNPTMRQHILNSKRHPTTFDTISIRKASKDSSKKIDVAVCCVLAYGARQEYLMSKNNRDSSVVALSW